MFSEFIEDGSRMLRFKGAHLKRRPSFRIWLQNFDCAVDLNQMHTALKSVKIKLPLQISQSTLIMSQKILG